MSKIIITLDSSQIKEFMNCKHKWQYAYNERLRYWNSDTKALDKGTFVHKLLETFYTLRTLNPNENRFTTQSTVVELFKAGKLGRAAGLDKDEVKLIMERFLQYVMKWSAYDFIPQKRNGVPGVELGFSKVLAEYPDYVFIVEGKIDLIAKTHLGGYDCFVDNKTTGYWLNNNYYAQKPQFRTYAWATGFNYGMVNYFKLDAKYDEDFTFRRQLIYHSDENIKEWELELLDLYYDVLDVMLMNSLEKVSDVKASMLKWNRGACGGKWETKPCAYTMICDNPRNLRSAIKQSYYVTVPKWSPWEPVNDD